ncbi:hypothetical protein BDD12DRAFT_808136 [Trichophaea hybrida]|nr:hypothetical protein BDD12DRAFT_808136 [Trichophaea hybrida]
MTLLPSTGTTQIDNSIYTPKGSPPLDKTFLSLHILGGRSNSIPNSNDQNKTDLATLSQREVKLNFNDRIQVFKKHHLSRYTTVFDGRVLSSYKTSPHKASQQFLVDPIPVHITQKLRFLASSYRRLEPRRCASGYNKHSDKATFRVQVESLWVCFPTSELTGYFVNPKMQDVGPPPRGDQTSPNECTGVADPKSRLSKRAWRTPMKVTI